MKKTMSVAAFLIIFVLIFTVSTYAADKKTKKTAVLLSLSQTEVYCKKDKNIPSVKVKTESGKVLKKDRDYTVSVNGDTSVCGRYKLTVTLKGDYTGKYSQYYKVVPCRPVSLDVKSSDDNRITLKWDKVKGAAGYVLYTYSVQEGAWVKVKAVDTNHYTVNGLTSLKRYLFAVKTCTIDKNGKKCYSEMRKTNAYTNPESVKGLKATAGMEKIKLTWNALSRADGYIIAYSTSKDFAKGTVTYKGTQSKDICKKFLLNLTGGKKVYIKIRSYGTIKAQKLYSDYSQVITVTPKNIPQGSPVTSATRCAVVYDVRNRKTLFAKNQNEKRHPASMTKLITACTALEYASPERVYTIGSEIRLTDPSYSICGLYEGYKMSLYEMLCGMLIPSGCDAAISIAAHIGKDVGGNMSNSAAVNYFCTLMNRFAKKIGMSSSHFNSPEGYEGWSHYTTAADMVKLVDYALGNSTISSIVKCNTKSLTIRSGQTLHFQSTNKFLNPYSEYYNPYVIGMKTGTNSQAGCCISVAYDNGIERLIIISMGNYTNYDRYNSVQSMIKKYTSAN